MSGKRRYNERERTKAAALQQAMLDALARGDGVDYSALAPHGSYSQPEFVERGYYVDQPFVCQDCGMSQIWTAAQQKWWYEIAKGYVFSGATRCRRCRQRERARREEARVKGKGGDANPFKNAGILLVKIRSEIEPKLLSAGYRPVGRNASSSRRALFIDYSRSEDLFTVSWDQHHARLAAELLATGAADIRTIASAQFSGVRSTSDIEGRLAPFIAAVRSFLDGLCEAPSEPECLRESSASGKPGEP